MVWLKDISLLPFILLHSNTFHPSFVIVSFSPLLACFQIYRKSGVETAILHLKASGVSPGPRQTREPANCKLNPQRPHTLSFALSQADTDRGKRRKWSSIKRPTKGLNLLKNLSAGHHMAAAINEDRSCHLPTLVAFCCRPSERTKPSGPCLQTCHRKSCKSATCHASRQNPSSSNGWGLLSQKDGEAKVGRKRNAPLTCSQVSSTDLCPCFIYVSWCNLITLHV